MKHDTQRVKEGGVPMRIAALTMVYRDHWFLKRWLSHYGSAFGLGNLYVVSHGDEQPIRDISKGANVIGIVKETAGDFDTLRWNFLNDLVQSLLKSYDCVVVGDVDELIIPDPAYGNSLAGELSKGASQPINFVTGFEVVERPDDPPFDDSKTILSQRTASYWNWLYTKACVCYAPCRVGRGAHFTFDVPYNNMSNLLMVHAKFANGSIYDELMDTRAHIREPGSDGKTRTPRGNGWSHKVRHNYISRLEKFEFIPFRDALEQHRAGVAVDPSVVTGKIMPKRFFLNKMSDVPSEFGDLV